MEITREIIITFVCCACSVAYCIFMIIISEAILLLYQSFTCAFSVCASLKFKVLGIGL